MTTTTSIPAQTTECSGDCELGVYLDLDAETVTVQVPSNGRRGEGHVPAHQEVRDLDGIDWDDEDEEPVVIYWTCPVCQYADSLDLFA